MDMIIALGNYWMTDLVAASGMLAPAVIAICVCFVVVSLVVALISRKRG